VFLGGVGRVSCYSWKGLCDLSGNQCLDLIVKLLILVGLGCDLRLGLSWDKEGSCISQWC